MSTKYIYVLLSQTQTRFAKVIRLLGKQKYNHAAISLDAEFLEVYAYARPQHNAVLLAHLVHESLDRYTLRRADDVPVVVFKIPVSEAEYEWVSDTVDEMLDNKEYLYNLFSVLSYPVIKGFSVRNTFTCIEFVSYILQHMGLLTSKRCWRYKPDDLLDELNAQIVYKGDVRGCMSLNPGDGMYFSPFSRKLFVDSIKTLCILIKRTCLRAFAGR